MARYGEKAQTKVKRAMKEMKSVSNPQQIRCCAGTAEEEEEFRLLILGFAVLTSPKPIRKSLPSIDVVSVILSVDMDSMRE